MVKNNQNGEMEIDLLQLFRALWRNALVIILVAIIFGGIAFGGTFMFISPKYEASAMMYVNNSFDYVRRAFRGTDACKHLYRHPQEQDDA